VKELIFRLAGDVMPVKYL